MRRRVSRRPEQLQGAYAAPGIGAFGKLSITKRTGTLYFPHDSWRSCEPIGGSTGRRTGCSPARFTPSATSLRTPCRGPSPKRWKPRDCRTEAEYILCVTRSQPICWKLGLTSSPFSDSWAIAGFRPRRLACMSAKHAWTRSAVRWAASRECRDGVWSAWSLLPLWYASADPKARASWTLQTLRGLRGRQPSWRSPRSVSRSACTLHGFFALARLAQPQHRSGLFSRRGRTRACFPRLPAGVTEGLLLQYVVASCHAKQQRTLGRRSNGAPGERAHAAHRPTRTGLSLPGRPSQLTSRGLAEVLLSVDGHEERWTVGLPEGIRPAAERVSVSRV